MFHQKAEILKPKVFEAKATFSHKGADLLPGHLTLAATHFFFSNPEEGTTTFVDLEEYADRKQKRTHEMSRKSLKNSLDKDRPTGHGQQLTYPTGEALVDLGNDRGKSRNAEFVSGQRES
jgi:hypothetical protein